MNTRAHMSAHVGRQQRERDIRTTTAPLRQNTNRSDWSATFAVVGLAGAWAGGSKLMLFVALVMAVVALAYRWGRS